MDIDNVIAEYKAGKTLQEIADIHGVSKQYIDQLLAKHNVPRRDRKKVTPAIKATIKELAEAGKDYAYISLQTGVSKATVCITLKAYGFKRQETGYKCKVCGGTEWRSNGKGRTCVVCANRRAREGYQRRKARN